MTDVKILFVGPMGAGKTTAIRAVSDIAPLSTDVHNTDQAQSAKATTTVALDYGELGLSSGLTLKLFGAPGQERFGFLRRTLSANALGVVVLLDNGREEPLIDLGKQIEGLEELLTEGRVVIGVGRLADHPTPTIDDYAQWLRVRGHLLPVFSVDVRHPGDVVLLLDALLYQIELCGTSE